MSNFLWFKLLQWDDWMEYLSLWLCCLLELWFPLFSVINHLEKWWIANEWKAAALTTFSTSIGTKWGSDKCCSLNIYELHSSLECISNRLDSGNTLPVQYVSLCQFVSFTNLPLINRWGAKAHWSGALCKSLLVADLNNDDVVDKRKWETNVGPQAATELVGGGEE